jgi:hypothetical protein
MLDQRVGYNVVSAISAQMDDEYPEIGSHGFKCRLLSSMSQALDYWECSRKHPRTRSVAQPPSGSSQRTHDNHHESSTVMKEARPPVKSPSRLHSSAQPDRPPTRARSYLSDERKAVFFQQVISEEETDSGPTWRRTMGQDSKGAPKEIVEFWGPSFILNPGTDSARLGGWKKHKNQGVLGEVLASLVNEMFSLEKPITGKTAASWINTIEDLRSGYVNVDESEHDEEGDE